MEIWAKKAAKERKKDTKADREAQKWKEKELWDFK